MTEENFLQKFKMVYWNYLGNPTIKTINNNGLLEVILEKKYTFDLNTIEDNANTFISATRPIIVGDNAVYDHNLKIKLLEEELRIIKNLFKGK